MSGSARSLQMSSFSGLRVASLFFTPEYSKNGANVSAKLEINAFMNMPGKQNNGEGLKDQIVKLTTWDKMAHIGAKSMSKGKEFNCNAEMRIFDKRVFMPTLPGQAGTPVLKPDGSTLTVKATSFTILKLTFGEESDQHISDEIALNVRPAGWREKGSPAEAQWKEILKARQAIQFDPNSPTGTYGFATIRMPKGPGVAAYIPNQLQPAVAAGPAAVVVAAAAPIAATVAVAPAAVIPTAAPMANANGFVVPASVPGV